MLAAYRKRIGLDEDDACPACGEAPEDAEHLLLNCASWSAPRLTYLDLDSEGSLTDNGLQLKQELIRSKIRSY